MKFLDRVLQHWRMKMALRYVPPRAHLLDIGTFDGRLFELGRSLAITGIGVDPELVVEPTETAAFRLIRGTFPRDVGIAKRFDAATALAVMEHVPLRELPSLLQAIHSALMPGGRFILSVPSPHVDRILSVLVFLRLVDGQSLEQHYGLETEVLQRQIAEAGFRLVTHERFQLGLNNLLVYARID